MKIRVLGAFGAEGLGAQRPSAFLLNDAILLDAGTVGGALSVPEQTGITHALVSHAHLDHVVGLAFLSETLALCEAPTAVTVTSLSPIIDRLRSSLFNDIVWPDFGKIPQHTPVLRYRALVEEAEQRVGDLWVTPVPVAHAVPTSGFILHDGATGLIFSGDTGPTQALWTAARGLRGIRAVILECAYPDRLDALARLAGHMTPSLVRRELEKLPDAPVWIYHIKPQFYDEVADQLSSLRDRVVLLEQDKTYTL